ncbi:hypothetical protein EDD86DRAFT_114016 [Gorgonomyces haynaldii]|nr:hypothetical protein EDD86DRAFT_114016 [Gorgonomyces haynaldii]
MKVPPRLQFFAIVQPSAVGESLEDQAKQIVVFYPPADLQTQVKEVGVLLAMRQFAKSLELDASTIKTKKSVAVIKSWKDYLIVAKWRYGAHVVQQNGKKYADYLEHELDAGQLLMLLDNQTRRYEMLYPSVAELESFWINYISTSSLLKPNAIQWAPFSQQVQQQLVQDCIAMEHFGRVILLYRDRLVYCGVAFDAAMQLVDYIIDPATGLIDDGWINQVKGKGESVINTSGETQLFSGVLIGPQRLVTSKLRPINLDREYGLVVYQYRTDWTVCLLLDTLEIEGEFLTRFVDQFQQLVHRLPTELTRSEKRFDTSPMYHYMTVDQLTLVTKQETNVQWSKDIWLKLWSLMSLEVVEHVSRITDTLWAILIQQRHRRLCLLLQTPNLDLSTIQGLFFDLR